MPRANADLDDLYTIDYRRSFEDGHVFVVIYGERDEALEEPHEVLVILDSYEPGEDRTERGAVSPSARTTCDEIAEIYTAESPVILARFTTSHERAAQSCFLRVAGELDESVQSALDSLFLG